MGDDKKELKTISLQELMETPAPKVRAGSCPKCETKLDYENASEAYDGGRMFEMTCPGCRTPLQEHYEEKFWGFSIPDSDGNYTGEMEFPAEPSPLQATAPELLETCKRFVTAYNNPSRSSIASRQAIVQDAQSLIAKATGEK